MPAPQNQGLSIALMIFFLLVILLSVTTYVFFKISVEREEKINEQIAAIQKHDQEVRDRFSEIGQYRKLLGFNPDETNNPPLGSPETPEPDSVLALFRDDMAKYAGNLEEDERPNADYRKVVAAIYDRMLLAQNAEAEAKAKEAETAAKFTSVESTAASQVTKFRDDASKVGTELGTVKTTFDTALTDLTGSKEKLAAQLEAKRVEMDEKLAEVEKERDVLAAKVQQLAALNQSLQQRLKTETGSGAISETPDGEVTWVNQRDRVVWINLGSQDNLERQTVFSVFPVDANQSPDLSRKKGNIEVTRIMDNHMAEARIVDDSVSDPILPGDKILSPVWDRGRSEGFALAGFMDIDKDGRSDRDKIRQLIRQSGGRIDAEVQDDGKMVGKIELNTRYIILGDAPTDKTINEDLLQNFSAITSQAQELTVEKISVEKFIQQMGFRIEERTVPLGRGARSEDFKAKPINGVQQKSTGNTSESFKPRVAPKKTTF